MQIEKWHLTYRNTELRYWFWNLLPSLAFLSIGLFLMHLLLPPESVTSDFEVVLVWNSGAGKVFSHWNMWGVVEIVLSLPSFKSILHSIGFFVSFFAKNIISRYSMSNFDGKIRFKMQPISKLTFISHNPLKSSQLPELSSLKWSAFLVVVFVDGVSI